MSDINWTDQQKLAINTIDGDVLLTAAAGAGKTAVLAQRCVYLVTQAPDPCDIDELLVMTFTEAAAAEMRRRIAQTLNAYAASLPQNPRLQRQIIMLDKAHISTVHAFCYSVLREFFYRVGVDPNFEIMVPQEAQLAKQQIAADLFEEYYSKEGQDDSSNTFLSFVQSYGSGRGDRPLTDLLIRMHNFLDTLTEHQGWINSWQQELSIIKDDELANLELLKRQKDNLTYRLDLIIARLEHAQSVIGHYPELDFYNQYVDTKLLPDFQSLKHCLASQDFTAALAKLDELAKLPAIPRCPRDLTADDVAPVKKIINNAKDDYKKMRLRYNLDAFAVGGQISATSGYANLLIELHSQFAQRYQNHKLTQNALDFADLEHKTLELLTDKDGPSDVALQLQRRFRYVLVDEYQDISPIQEKIIQYISRGNATGVNNNNQSGNLFMVGDVKQSIYGFRQADHEIILGKYRNFTTITPDDIKDVAQKKIDLNKNFRSRRGLIDGINYIFSRCMTEEFTGIDYRRQEQLVYGADYYDSANKPDVDSCSDSDSAPSIEIHLIERDFSPGQSDMPNNNDDTKDDTSPGKAATDASRREAVIIAQRIRQMVGADQPDGSAQFDVLDSQTSQNRPVCYRDIVILLRSMKFRAEMFSEVFLQMGIPVHAELTGGFFVATEIQDMISLLKLLDNPQQDIPLASVLRSPMVGLDESQLAAVRLHCPDQSYYAATQLYAQTGPDTKLREALRSFFVQLDKWRSSARQGRLAQLIWQIYRDTNFLAYVSGLRQGRQRHSNLLYLYERARQFDSFNCQGLARFLRFIEKLREDQGDFGPAPILTPADNVVRIMSIHKSKGLEFPVVIVADMNHKFNKADQRDAVLFDRPGNFPLALRVVDPTTRDSWATMGHNIIADNIEQRQLAEEMRILYVAMTRARERLLLIGSINLQQCRDNWTPWRHLGDKPLDRFQLTSASTPMDWLGPALASHPDFQDFLGEEEIVSKGNTTDFHFTTATYEDDQVKTLLDSVNLSSRSEPPGNLDEIIPNKKPDQLTPDVQQAIARIDWRYPYQKLTKLPARAGVTELKRRMQTDEPTAQLYYESDFQNETLIGIEPRPVDADKVPLIGSFAKHPSFMNEDTQQINPGEKGTLTHLYLEHLDLTAKVDKNELAKQLQAMTQQGFFTAEQAQCVNVSHIERFFASPLGQKMLANRHNLQREWSFTLAVPAAQAYPDQQLSAEEGSQTILVRGLIDCLFQTADGMVIVDFKTDNITPKKSPTRAESYKTQMAYYRQAVEAILAQPVTEMYLYFLTPGVEIHISN